MLATKNMGLSVRCSNFQHATSNATTNNNINNNQQPTINTQHSIISVPFAPPALSTPLYSVMSLHNRTYYGGDRFESTGFWGPPSSTAK